MPHIRLVTKPFLQFSPSYKRQTADININIVGLRKCDNRREYLHKVRIINRRRYFLAVRVLIYREQYLCFAVRGVYPDLFKRAGFRYAIVANLQLELQTTAAVQPYLFRNQYSHIRQCRRKLCLVFECSGFYMPAAHGRS